MKRSGKRLCSAFLLLGIALTLCVGLIYALSTDVESAPPEAVSDTYIWVRILLNADPAVEKISLYSRDGKPLQTLQTENGSAVSDLMTPGSYFAVTDQGCTQFVLNKNASISVSEGCGWSDGEQLFLTTNQVGTVTVERLAADKALTEDGGWVDYTLVNAKTRLREVVRCSTPEEVLSCVFSGVPYGDYMLEENGIAQCHVTVSDTQKDVAVALP